MQYLSEEEVMAINEVVVNLSGGSIGLRDVGLLASIVQKPQTSFAGEDMYPDVYLKAAVLYEAIVNYHVFIDGNKRTGFATMARFMNKNGYSLQLTDQEIEDFTVHVATSNPDLTAVATWIKQHSKKSTK